MTTRPPPVPPENRSDKAPSDETTVPTDTARDRDPAPHVGPQDRRQHRAENRGTSAGSMRGIGGRKMPPEGVSQRRAGEPSANKARR